MNKIKLRTNNLPPAELIPRKFLIQADSADPTFILNIFVVADGDYIYKASSNATYKAYDTVNKKIVAIKMTQDADGTNREIAVSKQFKRQDDKIIPIISKFEKDGVLYLVSDYYPGGYSFSNYMMKIPLNTTPDLFGRQSRNDVARKLITTIDELHKKGFSHQNLKESALVWDFFKETVRIIDFSRACSLNDNCTTVPCEDPCGFVGTFYTAAPEHAEAIAASNFYPEADSFRDTRAHDIWSLGVILLRWYTYDTQDLQEFDKVYEWFPEEIQEQINRIQGNDFAREILKLMLVENPEERVQNWVKCVDLAKKVAPTQFQVRNYNDVRKEFIKANPEEVAMIELAKLLTIKPRYRKTPQKIKYLPNKIEVSENDVYIMIDDGYIFEGSFGAVFEAVSVKTREIVAVKVVKSDDEDEIEHEINALQSISSICQESVVCYRDHYIVTNRTRIVMDFIKGGYNLIKYIKKIPLTTRGGMIGRQSRNDFAKYLILAVDKLHNETFITHQDLKEHNLLWDFSMDRPRITDLGNMCSFDNNCEGDPKEICEAPPCGFVGTFYTSNPENAANIANKDYNVENIFNDTLQHDVWSVGVILLRWYTYPQIKQWDSIYTWDRAKIDAQINLIPVGNDFARKIVKLLLAEDPDIRVNNWSECVRLATAETPVEFSKTPAYKKLRQDILKDTGNEISTIEMARTLFGDLQRAPMPTTKKSVLNLIEEDLRNQYTIEDIATIASNYNIDSGLPFYKIIKMIALENSLRFN